MVLEPGEKIHVITRRNFERDVRRHFIGEIIFANETVVRVEGYAYVFDAGRNEFVKRPEARCRIVSLVDASNLINVLPKQVNISDITYKVVSGNRLVITDNKSTFSLDINEFGMNR